MINIKEENKALCFQDSTPKPLRLYMYKEVESDETSTGYEWRLFRVLDEEIVLESANFTEGILEGEKFSLGSFVIPEMTIEWRNDGIRYKDFVCVPVQQIGNEYIGYEYIAYFNGYVAEETINTNGTTVKAKIRSLIGKKLDTITLGNIIKNPISTQTAFINDDDVNMRSGPGTSYGIVGKYSYEQVEIIETVTNEKGELWYKLKIIRTGDEGYIISDYITIEEEYPEDQEVAYIISAALKEAMIVGFDNSGNSLSEEDFVENLKNEFENANIKLSYFQDWEYNEILSKLKLVDFLRQIGEFLGCQVLISSKQKVTIKDLETPQPGFNEGINFVKIPQVSDLTETPIYQPPYYMNLQYDKTPLLNENVALIYQSKIQAIVNRQVFEKELSPSAASEESLEKTNIIIKDNFLFNKLASDIIIEQISSGEANDIEDVDFSQITNILQMVILPYIQSLNYYKCIIDYPYAPFLMPNDVILLDGENQKYMPKEAYEALEYVEIGNGLTVDTGILPSKYPKEISADFEITQNENVSIFKSQKELRANITQTGGNMSAYYITDVFKGTELAFSLNPFGNYEYAISAVISSTNLAKIKDLPEQYGVTFTKLSDGGLHIKGTANADTDIILTDVLTTYTVDGRYHQVNVSGKGLWLFSGIPEQQPYKELTDDGETFGDGTTSVSDISIGISLKSGQKYDFVTYPQINLGSEKLCFQPYKRYANLNLPIGSNTAYKFEQTPFLNECVVYATDPYVGFNVVTNNEITVCLCMQYNDTSGEIIGDFGVKTTKPTFKLSPFILNQKIVFNSRFEDDKYYYSGTYKGNGEYTELGGYENNLILGDEVGGKIRLYHFKYMENNNIIDIYPCIRKSDNSVGFYDTANKNFISITGEGTPNYLQSNIAIPILSCNTKGIHSMRATVECTATQLNSGE